MMRAMLLALYTCAPPSASAFVTSVRPFSARSVPQSMRFPAVVCAMLVDPDRDKMRDLKTLNNAMYSLYDIIFEDKEKNLPHGLTKAEVTQHLTSCATEFTETRNLHTVAEESVTKAIKAVHDEAYVKKRKLISEEKSAESAEIIAAAAQIAAAVFAWAPMVNFGLEAGALALYVLATGLEIDAEKYEKSVISYIGNMNGEVVKQPGMDVVEKWHNAVVANGAFYSRLDIGLQGTTQRAIMLSIPTGIQQHKLGSVDAAGYKAYIKQVGGFIFDNQELVGQYERLLASIDESTTPAEFKQAKLVIDKDVSEDLERGVDIFMDVTMFTLAAKDAAKYYKGRGVVNKATEIELDPIDENGDVVPGGEVNAGTEATEVSWLKDSYGLGEAISVLGGVGTIVMAGFQLKDTLKLESKLEEGIDTGTTGLTTYYKSLLKSAPNPDAPAAPSPPSPSPPAASACVFTTKASLVTEVQAYDANPTATTAKCGPIADWDVSAITDMSDLFILRGDFNADISNWDTSSVTTMFRMFEGAASFNQPLSFDTSSVTNMGSMFYGASAFDQALSFDTSSVTNMQQMFYENKLSAANKLLIRCAWAGTSAFASAGYGSSWAPGNCK